MRRKTNRGNVLESIVAVQGRSHTIERDFRVGPKVAHSTTDSSPTTTKLLANFEARGQYPIHSNIHIEAHSTWRTIRMMH